MINNKKNSRPVGTRRPGSKSYLLHVKFIKTGLTETLDKILLGSDPDGMNQALCFGQTIVAATEEAG